MSADPKMAEHGIRGWTDSWAPAFEGKEEKPILDRILQVGANTGYREISRSQLKQHLQSSRDKWLYRRRLIGRGQVGHVCDPIGDMVKGERKSRGAPLTTDPPDISMSEVWSPGR